MTALGEQVAALRSARPGDRAVLLADGSMRGFVGGDCAVDTVREQAMRLLPTGSATLLRITPSTAEETAVDGLVTVGNPCASGGALDIFLESVLPPPLLAVYGDAPVARALADVGAAMDAEVRDVDWPAEFAADLDAVVLASHGRGEEADVLAAALRAEVAYVGLIASPRRGTAVLDALDVAEEQRARVHTPAGLDIGAHTPGEIAVSVLAELIQQRPRHRIAETLEHAPPEHCCHHGSG
jgi:xanthine dehydrogenase accessory factor